MALATTGLGESQPEKEHHSVGGAVWPQVDDSYTSIASVSCHLLYLISGLFTALATLIVMQMPLWYVRVERERGMALKSWLTTMESICSSMDMNMIMRETMPSTTSPTWAESMKGVFQADGFSGDWLFLVGQ